MDSSPLKFLIIPGLQIDSSLIIYNDLNSEISKYLDDCDKWMLRRTCKDSRFLYKFGKKSSYDLCCYSAYIGSINLHDHCKKVAHNHTNLSLIAAENGNLDYLKYFKEEWKVYKGIWNGNICNHAAANGHLDCLKYLHENGCGWDIMTIFYAANYGNLDCLKYAHENGCSWDELAFCVANGPDCFKYLIDNKCPGYEKYKNINNKKIKFEDN